MVDVSASSEEENSVQPTVSDQARERIERAMAGRFAAGSREQPWPGAWSGGAKLSVPPAELPVPGLARWLLHDFLGGPDLGHDEKIAWQVRFTFDGRQCALAFEKFGLRLYFSPDALDGEPALRGFADELLRRLKKAIRVAESEVFRSFAGQQMADGQVTVTNQYHQLRMMYEHFRAAAENPTLPVSADDADDDTGIDFSGWNRAIAVDRMRFFNGVAMVNAYFSLLEHLIVLIWPFVNYQPGVDDLQRFVGDRWADKYKRLFDVNADRQAKTLYDRLRDAAEEYRNTYAHGAFDKMGGAFVIHFTGGAMPAVLSDIRDHRLLGFSPLPEPDLASITALFDEVDDWLSTEAAPFGVRYAQAGYDVPFNESHIDEARAAMTSDIDFDEWLTNLGYAIDNLSNMDW
jgi:hypothetical protein